MQRRGGWQTAAGEAGWSRAAAAAVLHPRQRTRLTPSSMTGLAGSTAAGGTATSGPAPSPSCSQSRTTRRPPPPSVPATVPRRQPSEGRCTHTRLPLEGACVAILVRARRQHLAAPGRRSCQAFRVGLRWRGPGRASRSLPGQLLPRDCRRAERGRWQRSCDGLFTRLSKRRAVRPSPMGQVNLNGPGADWPGRHFQAAQHGCPPCRLAAGGTCRMHGILPARGIVVQVQCAAEGPPAHTERRL